MNLTRESAFVALGTLSILTAGMNAGCLHREPPVPKAANRNETPFLVRRARFKTHLLSPGPSPQEWQDETPPDGIREVTYPSGDLTLKAWLYVPQLKEDEKRPVLVFFHGGFAFGASDMYDCQPFLDAGFIVMTPWLRGENGLPGHFETFYGELDDAAAAVRWISSQPHVDKDHIYTFGHSAGGVLSALLSLVEDVPIRYGGSTGGLYGTNVFDLMPKEYVAFDKSNPIERELRVLPGNLRWMKRKHYAFVGEKDGGVREGVYTAMREKARGEGKLQLIILPGDHITSYPTAMREFLKLIQNNP